jgi:hypothetical protein
MVTMGTACGAREWGIGRLSVCGNQPSVGRVRMGLMASPGNESFADTLFRISALITANT